MTELKDIIKTIQNAVNKLADAGTIKQSYIYANMMYKLKKLETQGDNIKTNINNLNIINEVQILLEQLMIDKKYKEGVKTFVKAFDDVQALNNQYFSKFGEIRGSVNEKLKYIKNAAVESTINNLTEAGIYEGVGKGLKKILITNIAGGGSYAELTEQLRDYIKGTPETTGAVERYLRTYATTSINQFSAEYNKKIADDLGLEWYVYEGSLLETSRPFCIKAVDKQYIHVSEFPALLKGDFGNNGNVPIYAKTGLPEGMMEGTIPENFPRRRGGWNCGHQLIATDETLVPANVIKSVHATQAYKEWKLTQPGRPEPISKPPAPAPPPFTPVTVSAMDKKRPKVPKKPAAPAETKPKDPHIAAIEEKNKKGIKAMEKAGVVYYPEMAKHWPADINLSFGKAKNSYFEPGTNKIVIADTERVKVPVYQKKIMLHEGAHATHFHNKIITNTYVDPAFNTMFNELKDIIKGKERVLHNLLEKEKDDLLDKLEYDEKKDIPIKNSLEHLGVLRDTLGGLTKGDYGFGHSKAYFQSRNNGMMEVFAHAVTVAELGNTFIDKDPMIKAMVEKMAKYGSQWLK